MNACLVVITSTHRGRQRRKQLEIYRRTGGILGLLEHHRNQITNQTARVLKHHSRDAQPNRTLEAVGEAVGEAGDLEATLAMQQALQKQSKKGKQTVLHVAVSPKADPSAVLCKDKWGQPVDRIS